MKFVFFLLLPLSLFGVDFGYDLNITQIPGNERVMVCFHGMGGSWKIAEKIKNCSQIESTLISFNFPDHDIKHTTANPHETTFGTVKELLPALYVLKKCVVDEGRKEIDLYGFSAGGGAVINVLALLSHMDYNQELASIGLTDLGRKQILKALEKGVIILDTPLKSVSEIVAWRGQRPELLVVEKRYQENGMVPIESLERLKGLSLNVIVHFQKPDDVLSNRDDALYIERLKKANKEGTTHVIIGYDSGHPLPHPTLWQYYRYLFHKDAAYIWKRFDKNKGHTVFLR